MDDKYTEFTLTPEQVKTMNKLVGTILPAGTVLVELPWENGDIYAQILKVEDA